MAKIPFTKLSLSKNTSTKELDWNGQKVEIKQYLPIENKLEVISKIISFSADDHIFYNPCKVEIYELLEIILAYTNINLTDKQQEDVLKLYDLFISSGFSTKVKELIPEDELKYIHEGAWAAIKEFYRYRDSAMGIMEQISLDKLTDIIDQIKNSDEIQNLQQLTTQLG